MNGGRCWSGMLPYATQAREPQAVFTSMLGKDWRPISVCWSVLEL